MVAVVALWLTRFAFVAYNADNVDVADFSELMWLSLYGLRFDLAAVVYFDLPYIAMTILPLPWLLRRGWLRVADWVYGVCTSLMLIIQLGDIPYYPFTGSRLHWSNILNMTNDDGLGGVLGSYLLHYWWAVALGAIFITATVWTAMRLRVNTEKRLSWPWRVGAFFGLGFLAFLAIRGRLGNCPPLSIPDATCATRSAPQLNVVLNSPFCVLRSTNVKKASAMPEMLFYSDEELATLRSSVHTPAEGSQLKRRNIVTIIIESGGAEWFDTLTVLHVKGELGLMPFLDSIAGRSTVFTDVIATSRMSVQGATTVCGGFPSFDPMYFMLSPYNANSIDTPATLLEREGWTTVFYYGVKQESFNIDLTAKALGHSHLVNRNTYNDDRDFDGGWGIFDEAMGQRLAHDLTELQQPFFATWFTISAHSPFNIPEGYDTSRFRHPEVSPERGLEYTDASLRRFFETASKQPWYKNTTFVITADHGNRDFKDTDYDGDFVRNRIPMIIYTPDGSMPAQRIDDIVMGQHDIAPTLLSLTGYDKPYVSLGTSGFDRTNPHFGIYRGDGGSFFIVGDSTAIYTDATLEHIEKCYNPRRDPKLTSPISSNSEAETLLRNARALMQDYTVRLNRNRMSICHEK